jgi:hypothetical protein
MRTVKADFLALTLALTITTTACGPGFRTLEDVSYDYNGSRENYCSLSKSYKNLSSLDSALDLISGNKELPEKKVKDKRLQEAVWLYRHNPEAHAIVPKLTAELKDILEHGNFKIVPKDLGGATEKLFLEFDDGVAGIFKADDPAAGLDPDAEIAAYRVSELLELDLVPMTVRRVVEHKQGTIQYFASGLKSGKIPHASAINFRKLLIFDYLVSITDRTVDNFLYWGEQNRVVAIVNYLT